MRGNDIARFQRLQRNGALEVVRSCLEVVAQKKGAKRLTRGVEKYRVLPTGRQLHSVMIGFCFS